MLAAVLAHAAATPAAADVIELAETGAVSVVASDVEPQHAAQGSDDSVLAIHLPEEAITFVSGSTAPAIYAQIVHHAAELNDVSPALLEALVWQESRWHAGARSPAGAIGLTQLMPGTARELGVNPHDVSANLFGGARYLRQQLDRFGGDVELALAAYNAGPGRVVRGRTIPNIPETQNYVRAVVDRLAPHPIEKGGRP